MKIVDLATKVLTPRLPAGLRNPLASVEQKEVLVVLLRTDDGLIGIGEAWAEGLSASSTVALLENDCRPLVLGEDPFFSKRLWEALYRKTVMSARRAAILAAISAIDIAIWDIIGKSLRQPIFKLLGATSDRVFTYASGGLYSDGKTADDLAEEMREYIRLGFRGVKIKIGGEPFEQDISRVAAVRESIGPDVRLMVDAVYSLQPHEALRFARVLEKYNVHFLEAPVSPHNLEGLRRVARMSPIPIAGNEYTAGRAAYRELVAHCDLSIIHLNSTLCGGITEAARICSLADNWCLPVSFHMASSAICFAANLHVAASIANCDSVECHMVHRTLFTELESDLFELRDGYIQMPDCPGLGIKTSYLTGSGKTA